MKTLRNLMVTMMVLVSVITAIPVGNLTAKAADSDVTRIAIEDYNDEVTKSWHDGMKLTDAEIRKLGAVVKAYPQTGKPFNVSATIKERNTYLHAKKGKVSLTFCYGNVTKSLPIKIGVMAKKLQVKATGKKLYEGQILTMADARRVAKLTVKYADGKEIKNFKGFLCKQIDKPVKANKKGKYKLTVYIGKKKRNIQVQVKSMKRLYVDTVNMTLTKGQAFNVAEFKAGAVVKAKYSDNSIKTLQTYAVSADPTVTGSNFYVTVKYGKFSDRISIPVKNPTPVPGPQPKQFTISSNVQGLGSVTLDGAAIASKKVNAGTVVMLSANPAEGYLFSGWKINGQIVKTNPYRLAVNSNITAIAMFEKKPVNMLDLIVRSNGGKVFVNGEEVEFNDEVATLNYAEGTEISVKPEDTELYQFKKLLVNGEEVELNDEGVYTFVVKEKTTIEANFRQLMGTVSVEGIGTVGIDGKDDVTEKYVSVGTSAIISAKDSEHFKFSHWEDEAGNLVSRDRIYPFTVEEAKVYKFIAVFEEVYELSVEAEHGTVKLDDEVLSGTTKELSKNTYSLVAIPDEGYELENWTDEEGNELGSELELEVQLDVNKKIIANFKKKMCTLSLGVSKNASNVEGVVLKANGAQVEAGEKVSYEYGTKIRVTLSYPANLQFVSWDCDGKPVYNKPTYEFDIKSDMTLEAVFNTVYKLTINRVGGPGRVKMAGKNILFEDDVFETYVLSGTYLLEAINNDEFEFVSYTGVNSSNTPITDSVYNFAMPAKDTEITVNFRETAKTTEVIFVTQYGEEVLKEAVAFGETVSEIPSYPKFGTTFLGWMLKNGEEEVIYQKDEDGEYRSPSGETLNDAIKQRTANKETVEVTGLYQENPVEYFSFDLIGGTVTGIKDGEMNEEGKYSNGTHIYVNSNPEDPDNQLYFNGWFKNGKRVGDYTNFDFVITEDTSLEAIFSGTPGSDPIPRLNWDAALKIDASQSTLFFVPKVDIPSNYTITQWGVLFSSNADLADEEITLDTVQNSRYLAEKGDMEFYPNNHRWEWSYTNEGAFSHKAKFRARIFCTIRNKNTNIEETVYGDEVIKVDLSNINPSE